MDHSELARAYAEAMGRPAAKVERLPGGAGNRTYWRASDGAGHSAVIMELPPEPGKSEEVSKDGTAHDLPFLNVHRYLERLGVRVPRIYLDAHRRGFVVLEDLTDRTLEMALRDGPPEAGMAWPEHRREIYARAIDQLAKLRAHAERDPDHSCAAFGRAFDYDLYQWEFEHFVEYGLLGRGAKPSEAELRELRTTFSRISQELRAREPGDERRSIMGDWVRGNHAFHDIIYRVAGLPLVEQMAKSARRTFSGPAVWAPGDHSLDGLYLKNAEQHRAIKQALAAGSAAGARALAREHVLSSFTLLETILEQVGAQPRDWQRGRAARRS